MVSTISVRAGLVPAWFLILASIGLGQTSKLDETAKPPEDPNPLRELTVSPADVPIPAMKYRLIPRPSDLNPGNAALLYLRIRHEMTDPEPLRKIDTLSDALDKPTAEFPQKEVRELVDSFGGRLRQIEFGARRQTCDWGYSLPEQRRDVIGILLPDAQEMRRWTRLLALKARLEVIEGKTDAAIQTLETSIAFGRHVGQGPFLINSLVGIAIEFVMLRRVEELVSQPDAPNLYWALTDLPRPLIDLRDQLSTEERMMEDMIPELGERDGKHSAAEWSLILTRIHDGLTDMARRMTGDPESPSAKALANRNVAAFRDAALPEARAYLRSRLGLTDDQVNASSPEEIVARFVIGRYQEVRDEVFKLSNLSIPESIEAHKHALAEVQTLKDGPLAILGEMFPSNGAAKIAAARLDRQVAAHRVLEALRIYAARHDGKLPATLADVKEVPIPLDPATGKPFGYRLDGKSALVTAPLIDNRPKSGVNWRITVRGTGRSEPR